MQNIFDISQFDTYKEDNRREVKSAKGGLTASLWKHFQLWLTLTEGLLFVVLRAGMNHGKQVGKYVRLLL